MNTVLNGIHVSISFTDALSFYILIKEMKSIGIEKWWDDSNIDTCELFLHSSIEITMELVEEVDLYSDIDLADLHFTVDDYHRCQLRFRFVVFLDKINFDAWNFSRSLPK